MERLARAVVLDTRILLLIFGQHDVLYELLEKWIHMGSRLHLTLFEDIHPSYKIKPQQRLEEVCVSIPPILNTSGGEEEIRTLDALSSMPVFETGAFDHSATSPFEKVPLFCQNDKIIVLSRGSTASSSNG